VSENVFNLSFGCNVHIQHNYLITVKSEFVFLHIYAVPKRPYLSFYDVGYFTKGSKLLEWGNAG
jgi:hypothetical protein